MTFMIYLFGVMSEFANIRKPHASIYTHNPPATRTASKTPDMKQAIKAHKEYLLKFVDAFFEETFTDWYITIMNKIKGKIPYDPITSKWVL